MNTNFINIIIVEKEERAVHSTMMFIWTDSFIIQVP